MATPTRPSGVPAYHQLLALIGGAALVCCLLFDAYSVWHNKELYQQTQHYGRMLQSNQRKLNDWQMFFQELVVYSSRQPGVDTILENHGIKPASAPTKPR